MMSPLLLMGLKKKDTYGYPRTRHHKTNASHGFEDKELLVTDPYIAGYLFLVTLAKVSGGGWSECVGFFF